MKKIRYYLLICLLTLTGFIYYSCQKEEHQPHNITDEYYEGKVTGLSEAFINLEETNSTIEQFNIEDGTVKINFTGEVPDFKTGDIITIDLDTMGYLKKVKSSQMNGNTVTLQTEPAYLNDVFVDIDFKLNTELIEPSQILKSTSTHKEISKALTDKEGYIHPVEIIYHDTKGKLIKKSAYETTNVKSDGNYKIINFEHDFSSTDLYGKNGDNIHFYITEGNIYLTSNAVFEFDFDYEGVLDENTKIKKGDLKTFKFYLDSKAGFKTKLSLDMTGAYKREDEKILIDLQKVTAKFVVGVVPVWISFDCDVYGRYILNADAALHADWGFESNHTLKVGGTYDKETDNFTPIKEYVPENSIYPLNINGKINFDARLELYPRVEVKFYSFYGPYAEIVPYISGNYNASLNSQITNSGNETFLAWNSGLDLGLDFRIGSELTFLWGLYDKEFGPNTYNCFENSLWKSPYKIVLLTQLPDEAEINTPISLTFKVTDLRNNPAPLCPIIMSGDGNFSKNIVITDIIGEAKLDWTLKSSGVSNITATIYNADKSEISHINISKSVNLNDTINILNGLVAYYPFNGNANDVSENNNNGTVYGTTLTSDRFGISNQAYIFDGVNDYIEINHSQSLNLNEQISISFWAKFETSGPYYFPYHIIEKYGCWGLGQRENDINWGITTDNGEFNVWALNFNYNQWYHFVMKYDGSNISTYVNGQLYASKTANGLIKTNTNKVYISRYNFGGDYYFDGTLDDFRIYNRAINESEVLELYHEGGWNQ